MEFEANKEYMENLSLQLCEYQPCRSSLIK